MGGRGGGDILHGKVGGGVKEGTFYMGGGEGCRVGGDILPSLNWQNRAGPLLLIY